MKVTNRDVWLAAPALRALCAEPWPVKTAYRLAKLSRKLEEHNRDIEQVRLGLIKQHGEINAKGLPEIPEGSPGWVAANTQFSELMAEETDIDWGPVELPADTAIALKPEILIPLMPFVTVDEGTTS